jgi:hypothetical protein
MASPGAGTLALDSTEDAVYLARLRCVVCSGAVPQSSGLDPVAPFIDFKTLLRLHNLVECHTTPEERGRKHAALAYFVMDVTLPLPRTLPLDVGLAEVAGNAMDLAVARYGTARQKAEHALRASELRASKKRQRDAAEPAAGAPAAPTDAAPAVKTANAVERLDRTVYVCDYGSTPLPPGVRPKRRCRPSSRIALARSARVCWPRRMRTRLSSTGCIALSSERSSATPMRRWTRAIPSVV